MSKSVWKNIIVDHDYLPIEWKTNPHCAFKPFARSGLALLGSFGTVGLFAIRIYNSGRLSGFFSAPPALQVLICLVFGSLLLIAVIYAASEKHQSLVSYIRYGAAYSTGVALIFQTVLDTIP